jgi:hypothetical protein
MTNAQIRMTKEFSNDEVRNSSSRYLVILSTFALRHSILVFTIWLLSSALAFGASEPNTLTDQEKKDGWQLLFDGKTFDGWRSFKSPNIHSNWIVSDECLHHLPKDKGGHDLISDKMFGSFELEWDWKIAPKANSGVKYFITEDGKAPLGFEYQMVDDKNWDPKHSQLETIHGTGSFYDMLAPTNVHTAEIGQFNHSRIVVSGDHLEHWLNGQRVVQCDLGSRTMKSAIARSKFKAVPRFGEFKSGHILLQDHGDEAWFRNIKIRTTRQAATSKTAHH